MTLLNKFNFNISVIAFLLFISFPVFVFAKCDMFYKKPSVSSVINYGDVVYNLVDKSEIEKFDKLPNPEKTMGVTVADLQIKYDFNFEKYSIEDGICINIDKVKFFVGYEDLYVLINNKYNQKSCEYNAIKQHEIKHVNIYQKQLKYYGKLLIEEINLALENIKPFYSSKDLNNKTIAFKIEQIISKNKNINLIKDKLEKAIISLNKDIDTDEEFLRVKSLCVDW